MRTLIIRPDQASFRHQQLNFGTLLAIGWRTVRRRFARRRQRDALRAIADDPHLLRDLGLTREEALGEADTPFWQ
jgi:uncharacterized protein YjiS (DUF1127 family)